MLNKDDVHISRLIRANQILQICHVSTTLKTFETFETLENRLFPVHYIIESVGHL